MSIIKTGVNAGNARRYAAMAAVTALLAAALQPFSSYEPGASAASSPVGQVPAERPLYFERNSGQTDPSVRFLARSDGGTFFFTQSGVTVALDPAAQDQADGAAHGAGVVRLEYVGADAAAVVSDEPELEGEVNYFMGADRANWVANVPTFASISYIDLYEGITLKYEGDGGRLKGTYVLAPGAAPEQIRWRYAGSRGLDVDSTGNLLVGRHAERILLTEQAPVAWQDIAGTRRPVEAHYLLAADGLVRFDLGAYDPTQPLIIDPTISFSTYLGGSSTDTVDGIAVDQSGNVYVTGQTASTNFPTAGAYQPVSGGPADAFITKFSSAGAVVYSTYLGGAGSDFAHAIAVDPSGNAYLSGQTSSANFPTQNGYQPTSPGGNNGFLTKLNATGSALLYSTYFGGNATDYAWGVAVDATGNAYITGNTGSSNFPLLNAYQAIYGGGLNDAFLARLDTTASGAASLIYSTYLGGTGADYGGGNAPSSGGHGVAVDGSGNAFVTGETTSGNFPTRNAYDPSLNGGTDVWVSKIATNVVGDPSLIYSTFLGGSGCCDYGRDVDIDSAGNAYVTGQTNSANFPTANAYQSCVSGPFVTKFNDAGNALVYSTCFGSGGAGAATDIAVDVSGRAHVTGSTNSPTFPQAGALQTYGGGGDAFVLSLGASGNTLLFSTFLGGSANDAGIGIATDGADKTYVGGSTISNNFPTHNPFQPANAGSTDGFVSAIDQQGPTVTPTLSTTSTRTATRTATSTPTGTSFATNTPTYTPTNIPSASSTPTRRPTNTQGPTSTAGPTNSPTSSPTVGGTTPTPCVPNFSDVAQGDYFYLGVAFLYCRGAISGYADGTFKPYNHTSRGQLIKIVSVAENWVLLNPAQPHFSDVPPGSTFYTYIETAVERDAISGYADGTFRPYNNVTRGQVSKIISIARRWPLIDPVDPHFADVGVENTFYVFIETAYSKGVISGYSDGTFGWANNATRGQLSKIVHNAITAP